MPVEAFPLSWPVGMARTTSRKSSPFSTGFGAARNKLFSNLKLLGAQGIVVSTNIPLKRDGQPRANLAPYNGDPGVAVFFNRKNMPYEFCCDRWKSATDNVYAVALTLEALRGIERWGASDMLQRAFEGFKGLPAVAVEPWREVLMLDEGATLDAVERVYKLLATSHHPDRGGTADAFDRITKARDAARQELGGA